MGPWPWVLYLVPGPWSLSLWHCSPALFLSCNELSIFAPSSLSAKMFLPGSQLTTDWITTQYKQNSTFPLLNLDVVSAMEMWLIQSTNLKFCDLHCCLLPGLLVRAQLCSTSRLIAPTSNLLLLPAPRCHITVCLNLFPESRDYTLFITFSTPHSKVT